ncbi:hypothetical protein BD310DRAFT_33322 [Dichomitus squalens]|uniref:Uncharacterized protein n=1 Tax=Dichomitus squalens TaxID=114155 RepID=A0A4V2KA09_9APHY|nr:hypothetical protein BD310DRAFT_33322 [Dichomitus squalens]
MPSHLPSAWVEAVSSGVPTTSPRTVQHFLIDFPEAPPGDHSPIWQDEGPQASPCRFSRLVPERGQHATELAPVAPAHSPLRFLLPATRTSF